MKNVLLKLIFFLLLSSCSLLSSNINSSANIFIETEFYVDNKNLEFNKIKDIEDFKKINNNQLNLGVVLANVWVKIKVKNNLDTNITRAIVFKSHRLENLTFYKKVKDSYFAQKYKRGSQDTLYPYFLVNLKPKSTNIYYLKISSKWAPILFTITLEKEKSYLKKDKKSQILNMLFIGILLSLAIYIFFISFYSKDKSYLFYSIYLLSVIYQQISFMGFGQVLFSSSYLEIDKKLVLSKVGLMVITTVLFAISFLKTKKFTVIDKIYKIIIIVAILEVSYILIVPYLSTETIKTVAKIFVLFNIFASIFNLFAAIYIYKKGNKEARLYILGFTILFIAHVLWTLGTLGISSAIYNYPEIIIIGTTLEAIILSVAFVDRYIILQEQKQKAENQMLKEIKNREVIVKNEVIKKTKELKSALDTKELLLREVNHRVKNNLQIILSIVRIQKTKCNSSDSIEDILTDIENKIQAIAKTYTKLLEDKNLKLIDMMQYVSSLTNDLKFSFVEDNINFELDISVSISLKEAVYIGLIINEAVTNSYKYAFENIDNKKIYISIKQNQDRVEIILKDNGNGLKSSNKHRNSLGIKLIKTLATKQLHGDIEITSNNGLEYKISYLRDLSK
jgi:two-component sensor histidine kinase